jgi:hypothetical protein
MHKIITIPLRTLKSLCQFPVKWIFSVANLTCDGHTLGTLYREVDEDEAAETEMEGENKEMVLRLQKIEDNEMISKDPIANDYYLVGRKSEQQDFLTNSFLTLNPALHFVDPAAMSDRQSDSQSDQRANDLRPLVILRDYMCVVCGKEDASGCEAAHVVPHCKGNDVCGLGIRHA